MPKMIYYLFLVAVRQHFNINPHQVTLTSTPPIAAHLALDLSLLVLVGRISVTEQDDNQ
jgi:hypothetical protein